MKMRLVVSMVWAVVCGGVALGGEVSFSDKPAASRERDKLAVRFSISATPGAIASRL